jgi:hypothetical protein
MVHQQVDWARNQFPMGRAAELALSQVEGVIAKNVSFDPIIIFELFMLRL